LPKFSIDKIVNAQRSSVFEIFSDFENYQKLLSQHFPSVRVRSIRNNIAVVEEHMMLGDKELIIMAKHVSQSPLLHEVFVIGGDAKGSHIKEQFLDHSDGTKLLIDVDLKLKGKMKISELFAKNNLQENYSKIIDDFVKIAEN
jgi:coenzyme Q-binding protein COQ10